MNQIQIEKLQTIYNSFEDKIKRDDWLSNLNYSEAFVVCVGAGPWKIGRRRTIQQMALKKLGGQDLSKLEEPINWYPLLWQNQITSALVSTLARLNVSMDELCKNIKLAAPTREPRHLLYYFCHRSNGCKVLSLYCRDKLNVDSFPIDRHVLRFLKNNGLPTGEDDMVKLCKEANLNPCEVACGIVKSFGAVENPKW